jgi:hypothetical protein
MCCSRLVELGWIESVSMHVELCPCPFSVYRWIACGAIYPPPTAHVSTYNYEFGHENQPCHTQSSTFNLVSCNMCIQLKINRGMQMTERGRRLANDKRYYLRSTTQMEPELVIILHYQSKLRYSTVSLKRARAQASVLAVILRQCPAGSFWSGMAGLSRFALHDSFQFFGVNLSTTFLNAFYPLSV